MNVDPAAIRRFADVLSLTADNAVTARDYVSRYGNLTFGQEGLLSTARFVHDDFVETLTGTLNHVRDLLTASSTELGKAADYYQHTDAAAVARTDSAYPDAPRSLLSPS